VADELKDIKNGLAARLRTITGLRVFVQPEDDPKDFPSAHIFTDDLDYEKAMAGNTFECELRVTVLITKGKVKTAWEDLDNYLNPVGAKSIKAAVEADRTLDGKADHSYVRRAEGIQRSEIWEGHFVGADFLIRVIKSVA